jgi:hypothetical protein
MFGELTNKYEENSFRKSLAETIAWCTTHGSLDSAELSLRAFQPVYEPLISRWEQVLTVIKQRADQLHREGFVDLAPAVNLGTGRLMAYFPNGNLADGAAAASSDFFFDYNNCPPPDTWVWWSDIIYPSNSSGSQVDGFGNDFLIAWCPPMFLELANNGIKVNPEECICWLDALDIQHVQPLRTLNLIS